MIKLLKKVWDESPNVWDRILVICFPVLLVGIAAALYLTVQIELLNYHEPTWTVMETRLFVIRNHPVALKIMMLAPLSALYSLIWVIIRYKEWI